MFEFFKNKLKQVVSVFSKKIEAEAKPVEVEAPKKEEKREEPKLAPKEEPKPTPKPVQKEPAPEKAEPKIIQKEPVSQACDLGVIIGIHFAKVLLNVDLFNFGHLSTS